MRSRTGQIAAGLVSLSALVAPKADAGIITDIIKFSDEPAHTSIGSPFGNTLNEPLSGPVFSSIDDPILWPSTDITSSTSLSTFSLIDFDLRPAAPSLALEANQNAFIETMTTLLGEFPEFAAHAELLKSGKATFSLEDYGAAGETLAGGMLPGGRISVNQSHAQDTLDGLRRSYPLASKSELMTLAAIEHLPTLVHELRHVHNDQQIEALVGNRVHLRCLEEEVAAWNDGMHAISLLTGDRVAGILESRGASEGTIEAARVFVPFKLRYSSPLLEVWETDPAAFENEVMTSETYHDHGYVKLDDLLAEYAKDELIGKVVDHDAETQRFIIQMFEIDIERLEGAEREHMLQIAELIGTVYALSGPNASKISEYYASTNQGIQAERAIAIDLHRIGDASSGIDFLLAEPESYEQSLVSLSPELTTLALAPEKAITEIKAALLTQADPFVIVAMQDLEARLSRLESDALSAALAEHIEFLTSHDERPTTMASTAFRWNRFAKVCAGLDAGETVQTALVEGAARDLALLSPSPATSSFGSPTAEDLQGLGELVRRAGKGQEKLSAYLTQHQEREMTRMAAQLTEAGDSLSARIEAVEVFFSQLERWQGNDMGLPIDTTPQGELADSVQKEFDAALAEIQTKLSQANAGE